MNTYQPLNQLPADIQTDWGASLQKSTPTEKGAFRLVAIRRTKPRSFEEQRVIVLVVDENGFPMPNVRVAFSFSTAKSYQLTPDFLWNPPHPQLAFIAPTTGGGQIDMILGAEGVVKPGQTGGVTCYILEPEFSSDVVTGLGMLADHAGIHATYQLRRTGVLSIADRIAQVEARLDNLEGKTF